MRTFVAIEMLSVLVLAVGLGCSDESIGVPDASIPDGGGDLRPAADLSAVPDLADAPDLAEACGDVPVLGPQFDKVSAACRACTIARCCHQLTACADDADCVATRECYLACSGPDDTACTNQCRDAHGHNVASDAVSLCRNAGCMRECANFSCVGNVVWPPPAHPSVSLSIAATDYRTGSPVADAMVKICLLADAACAMPVGKGTTDAEGLLPVTLPTAPGGQGAYLEIVAAGYPVTLVYIARPVDQALDGSTPNLALLDADTVRQQAASVELTQDPAKAMVSFVAYQCATFRAPGLTVSAGSGIDAYLIGNELSTRVASTDRSGSGAVFNVTPGLTTVASTLQDKRYGSQPVVTRPGAVTLMNVVATP